MGACAFLRVGRGTTDRQAYDNAYEAAVEEKGHQEGYSGDLNSKDGYTIGTPPEGILPRDWIHFIENGDVEAVPEKHRATFERQHAIYDDKHELALCVKLNDNTYAFLGIAPE